MSPALDLQALALDDTRAFIGQVGLGERAVQQLNFVHVPDVRSQKGGSELARSRGQ